MKILLLNDIPLFSKSVRNFLHCIFSQRESPEALVHPSATAMAKDNAEQVSLNTTYFFFFTKGSLQVVACTQFSDVHLTRYFTYTYMKDLKQGTKDTSSGILSPSVSLNFL